MSQRLLELTVLALVLWFTAFQTGASGCFRNNQVRALSHRRPGEWLGVALLVLLLAQVALRLLGFIGANS